MARRAISAVPKIPVPPHYRDAAEASVALDPQEALFCFSATQLEARARVFLNHFPGEVSYAVKCNPSEPVIRTLAQAGIRIWDVASVHEMRAVRAIAPASRFHYHNPVKSRREIKDAFEIYACGRFAVDCQEELAKIAEVTGATKGIEVAIRFVLPRERTSSAHDFSTKFGAPEHVAVKLLKDADAMGCTPLLTFHPGSQSRDPQVYVRHIDAAARIVKQAGVQIAKLNVGGGFPANYVLSKAPEPQVFFAAIEAAVVKAFGAAKAPALECEPGRGLASPAMSLLTRVKLVCSDGDDIFINDGVYGGLMEFMQVPELMPPFRVIRDGQVVTGPTKSFKVFGPTCDPLDVLPQRLDLPADLRDEDFIEFGMLGAYGIATTTRFNGYGDHAIVAVDEALAD
jgi:ornithine decarboxylase